VRYRSCQLLSKILKALGDEVAIDNELFDRIHERMFERLKDKVPAVRVQAVLAVMRLQNPQDKSCPIIAGLYYKSQAN
jgi:condensin complex subunit 3